MSILIFYNNGFISLMFKIYRIKRRYNIKVLNKIS